MPLLCRDSGPPWVGADRQDNNENADRHGEGNTMKSSLYQGDISPLSASFHSAGATAQRGPLGIFDLRRSGAVIAAVIVVASAAGVITFMSGDGSGSLQAPAEAERPIKGPAPIANSDAPPPAHATVTTPRGPRVRLARTPTRTPLPDETAPTTTSAASARGGNATAMQAPGAASAGSPAAGDLTAAVRDENISGSSVDTVAPITTDTVRLSPVPPAADAEPTAFSHPAATNGAVAQVSGSAEAAGSSAAAPKNAVPPPAAKTASQVPSGLIAATTTTSVHLRAGPDNNAKVIATVPANASIMAPPSCKFWCAVEYHGERGYIYKDFVKRPGSGTEHG